MPPATVDVARDFDCMSVVCLKHPPRGACGRMEGVARHRDHFYTFGTLFEQAANGSLPHFSMIRGT